MRITWSVSVLLAAAFISLPLAGARAQNAATNSTPDANLTNAPVTMKELMTTNSVVTNTVGMVLVKISPGFWAGKYDVTQEAYQKVMQNNPSAFRSPDRPVDTVSWDDAVAFCDKLTTKEKSELPTGYSYSLPTQDQWLTLVGDASLKDAVMKVNEAYGGITSTAPVGSRGPNNLGLYDMRGNVWAWCLDSHDPSVRVLRGGAWDTGDEPSSRVVFRWYYSVANDKPRNDFGFRVVLQPATGQ